MSVVAAHPAIAESAPTKRRRIGPYLPIASLVIAAGITGALIAVNGFEVTTFIEAIRYLTKVSFLIFLLVFVTRPLHDLFGNRATAWLLANRRYLGLSFAAWHLMHWPILGSIMGIVGPATFWELFGGFAIPAGSVLVVISILAATSSNAAQRFLGRTLWGGIHTVGIYVIWAWFGKVYVLGKLVNSPKPYIFVYVTLYFAAMALRLSMAARRLAKKS